jgi:hypothetical protein
MSRKLGYESFTELGYKRMNRIDYGRTEIELFRQMVLKYIVPVCSEIRRLQRSRLETLQLNYWICQCFCLAGILHLWFHEIALLNL